MTQPRDIDQLLDQWFSDGPTRAPDRVIDVVADRIERQSQRPAWRLQWKDFQLNTYLKPIAAAAAVVGVAVIGFSLINGPSRTDTGGPGPTAAASLTSRPSSTVAPSPSITPGPSNAAVGNLTPGTWDSRAFAYPLSYTIPATGRWRSMQDYPAVVTIQPEGAKPGDGIAVWAAVYVAAQDAACSESPDPGRGHRAADFIDLLTTHPGIVATAPAAVTVGGLKGSLVDVALAPSWKTACPFSEGTPFVPFVTDSQAGPPGLHQGIAGGERARLIFLDAKDGETILVYIDSADGTTFDAIVAQTEPIVESFVFKP